MKNRIILIGLLISVISLYSCTKLYDMNQPEEPKVEYSSTYPLSGEWWVKYYDDAALTNDIGGGYYPLFTYNTAANDGQAIWINDDYTFWWYTVKCPVDVSARTFAGNQLISTAYDPGPPATPYDIWVSVTGGKVIEKGGLSTSGVVCDSITFALEFEDDPGTIYYVGGVRRTGFLEDEH